jgi:hypothetical protein
MRSLAIPLAFAVAGCASLPDDGALICGPDPAHQCPAGFHCADDSRCYRTGHDPDLGMVGPDDMGGTPTDDMTGDMAGAGGDMATYVGAWKRYAMTSSPTTLTQPRFVWGTSATDLYLVATDSAASNRDSIWHSVDGVNWSEQYALSAAGNVNQIWGPSPTDLYAVGTNVWLHSTGNGTWAAGPNIFPAGTTCTSPNSIAGFDATNFYIAQCKDASNNNAVFHMKPAGGVMETTGAGAPGLLWGPDPTSVYGVSGLFTTPLLYHTDGGGTWTTTSTPCAPTGVWGSSANNVYVIGACGTLGGTLQDQVWLVKTDGTVNTVPQLSVSQTSLFTFIAGTSASDIYVGSPVYQYAGGGNWAQIAPFATATDTFEHLWAASANNKYLTAQAGAAGIIWIYQ